MLTVINQFLWSCPLLLLLMGAHLYFSFSLGFPQKQLLKALKFSKDNSDSQNLSPRKVLWTTLAVTLGTGNIVGISTAIALGGPGALFWCFLTGLFGMGTSLAENLLSLHYRRKDENGIYHGGPMYVLRDAIQRPFLAFCFAILLILVSFLIGSATQSVSLTDSVSSVWNIPKVPVAAITAFISALVILGGITRIASFCEKIVPLMCILYFVGCFWILLLNRNAIFPAIRLILQEAFQFNGILSGGLSSGFFLALRYGIARGLFTNEAGLGTSPIAACASESPSLLKQAFVSMTAVFWDTVIMCTVTGLVIVTNQICHPASVLDCSDSGLTAAAFSLIPAGENMLSISLVAFAFTTLVSWSYYGEQAILFLIGTKGIFPYRLLYILFIFLGGVTPLYFVFELNDLLCALLATLNLYLLWKERRNIRRFFIMPRNN